MHYGVCCVAVAPIRAVANHRMEMVSQLLFGEYCTITDTDKNGWVNIICKADGYTGWCQLAHVQQISKADFKKNTTILAADWVNEIVYNGQLMFISMGSLITNNQSGIKFNGKYFNTLEKKNEPDFIKQIAFKYLNTTYLWGGRSIFGIDCSGFAQAVYKFLNIPLLRDAHLQATQGEIINFLQEAHCGDLAFFDDEQGEIIHVGILLSEKEIIHASTKVRIDKIDNEGILNTDTGERTHKLRIIKRYF